MPRLQASAAYLRALDDNARALNGALVKVYFSGTTTQITTYSNAAMTIANPWPVIADAAGRFPDIYVPPGLYRIRVETAGGVLIDESDSNVVYGMDPGDPASAKFKTVAMLKADETMDYAAGGGATTIVTVGDIVEAGEFRYAVLASGASGPGLTTANGVKLQVLVTAGVMPLDAFDPPKDGVGDATAQILAAAAAATAAKVPLRVRAGTYRQNATMLLKYGLIGDGRDDVLFQGVDDGTVRLWLIRIEGSGVYEGFTADGACSPDPAVWDATTYNVFTGWQRTVSVAADDVILRNVHVQNSIRACVDSDRVTTRNLFENVTTNRSRGVFGDGFYIRRTSQTTFLNCRAYDFTRIGFVNEGITEATTDIALHNTYIGCTAEFGHDQDIDYGGGNINCGFWAENANIITYIGCEARNVGDRGFTYAATSLNPIAGFDGAQVSYINCYAEDARSGFEIISLDSAVPVSASLKNCVSSQCTLGITCVHAIVAADAFQFYYDGGGPSIRAVSANQNVQITLTDLFTKWTNQGSGPTDPDSDSCTVGRFSTNYAKSVRIINARTHDGAPITVKSRALTGGDRPETSYYIEDTSFIAPRMRVKDFAAKNCKIRTDVTNSFSIWGSASFENTEVLLTTGTLTLGSFETGRFTIRGCRFDRLTGGSGYLYFFNNFNTDPAPNFFISDTAFVGNIAEDDYIMRASSETALATQPRTLDLFLSNVAFHNRGATTSNAAILLSRSVEVSTVFASGVWKSATITNLATRTATGSVVNDRA